LDKFPLAVQGIIAKESECWPAVGIIHNYDADDEKPWPTDWWQIYFSNGICTGVKIYDLWFQGNSDVPNIKHVFVDDKELLKMLLGAA
jgi:hypothetical protein